ncbi:MAG: hypothetical protein HC912_06305 [Saprospiraceae bacterium]|nr:hypothetical protein [Saprospiraceae bacterium]
MRARCAPGICVLFRMCARHNLARNADIFSPPTSKSFRNNDQTQGDYFNIEVSCKGLVVVAIRRWNSKQTEKSK